MKILWHTSSSGDTFNIQSSLHYLDKHEVRFVRYDQRWHEQSAQAVNANPNLREVLHAGGWRALGWPRERVAMDADMIRTAEEFRPDIQIFTSCWEGLHCPLQETLTRLNEIAPMVHMCHDAQDPPWTEQLLQFDANKCFATQLNIDGGFNWPGGKDWPGGPAFKGLTLLTPVDPRPYRMSQSIRVSERFYPLGYAGNTGGPIRGYMVQQMIRNIPEIIVRQRQESPDSYLAYADFLRNCRVVINVPFTGSNASKHVKGRVVEAGYAGTCLMEWHNPQTQNWFLPRHDYHEYGQGMAIHEATQDAIERAKFLIARPRECEDIAMALHEKVLREHSPEVFWSRVFEAVSMNREAEKAAEPQAAD